MKNSKNLNSVKNFVATWKNSGYEKGEMQPFWLAFLRDILNISEPEKFIKFEVPVKLKHKSFIDAFLSDTEVIIEQRSSSVNLLQEKNQSDGEFLTPFEQARRYGVGLPVSMHRKKLLFPTSKNFWFTTWKHLSYPNSSLADLYDPILMPKDLCDAHKKNDLAVMAAYGFEKNFSESEIVAELMKLYQNLTEK